MGVWEKEKIDGLFRHIGETVTIFTTSGGISGSGFTGNLMSVDECFVRLLVVMGGPPTYPLEVWPCNGMPFGTFGPYGGMGGYGGGYGGGAGFGGGGGFGGACGCGFDGVGPCGPCCCNQFGSIVVIPVESIAAISFNTI